MAFELANTGLLLFPLILERKILIIDHLLTFTPVDNAQGLDDAQGLFNMPSLCFRLR